MDAFLIPLFITAVLCCVFVMAALVLYAVPVRCAIRYFREEGREESTITVSWGPVAGSITRGARHRVTRRSFWRQEDLVPFGAGRNPADRGS